MADIQLDAAERFFDDMGKKMREGALKGVWSAADKGIGEIQRIIDTRSPKPVDKGIYRAGWRAEHDTDGATIENNEPHAPFIEYGVRAENVKIGRQMIIMLTEWVKRKGVLLPDETPEEAAWRIAGALKKRGIFKGGQGMRILEELIEQHIEKILDEEISAELERALG